MRTTIQQWGNSLSVHISKALAQKPPSQRGFVLIHGYSWLLFRGDFGCTGL